MDDPTIGNTFDITTNGRDVGLGTIDKKHLDTAFVSQVDLLEARLKHLEKLVGQLYYPHNPHV